MVSTWTKQSKDLVDARRIDSEFCHPQIEKITNALVEAGSVPLGRWVTSARRGVGPEYCDSEDIRVVKTTHIRRLELADNPKEYVSQSYLTANPKAAAPANSLLITSTGVGSAGRCFAKFGEEPLFVDGHVAILPVTDPDAIGYLCAYLQSPVGRQQIIRLHRGSSRQIEIYPDDLLSVQIPVVEDAVKESISTRWNGAVELVRRSRAAALEAESAVERFIFPEGDGDLEDSRKSWSTSLVRLAHARRLDAEFVSPSVMALRERLQAVGATPLSELVISIYKGFQPESYEDDASVYVIKSKDVSYPDFDLGSCTMTFEEDWPVFLNGGELLVNMTGEGTLGRAGVVPKIDHDQSVIPSVDIQVLEVDRSLALPEYIALYLNSDAGRRISTSLQTGSSGQQHLYPTHFSLMPIPFRMTADGRPDLEWQREIVTLAEQRTESLRAANRTLEELDAEFEAMVGGSVDLSTIPV